MKKLGLLKNAALLTLTGLILRALGMVLRIYISARIGEEGMGLYQLISSVYFLFITLAQSGISVAVTRYTSNYYALSDELSAYRVLKSGIVIALAAGGAASVLMFGLSGVISGYWIADTRTVLSLRVLALSLPFIAVCNVLSAYFIAKRNVVYGCSAQILEQLTRMAVVALAAAYFSNYGIAVMLAAVFAANTVSEAVSCLYLSLRLMLSKDKPYSRGKPHTYKRTLARFALPVALSRYLASALHTAENMLVPSAITLFVGSRTTALSEFGALKGMALPLLFFPSSFLNAMSTLLVPEITEAYARQDRIKQKSIIDRACSLTLALSIMAGGVFLIFSKDLGSLIYNSDNVSMMLFKLAPIVPFMYLDSICDGLLKGLGKQKQVLYHNCIDSGLRILLIALIVPRYGINGFIAIMVVSNVLVSTLNLRLLLKTVNVKCDVVRWILIPLGCTLISAIITIFLHPIGATMLKTALDCVMFCLVFLVLMTIFYKTDKRNVKT